MSDGVSGWLEQLGLGRYRQAFAENHIEERILLQLTDADLKELGVASLGHRKILLQAITALREEQVTEAAPGAAAEVASPVRDSGSHDAERRQLTIMFCDLAGSTELSQQLDPEDLREVNRSYQDAVKSAIEHFGGYVARYMGDGVLAYFGYPMAHEDDAERAVRAGLSVVETMDRFNARTGQATGAELAVRVGIATGPVVVGDLIGEGASQESAVVGETPNLAARLQGLARRNTVVIAPGTKRLAGRMFDYRDLGENRLKGIADPVQAWEVLGESGVESRFEAIRGSRLSPLVGRQEELDLLLSRWRRATEGEGQLVLLSGEPGIGKSRLTEAVIEQVAGTPHALVRYYCSPHHTNSAMHPVIGQLRRAAGFLKDDETATKLGKLEILFGRAGGRADEAVSLVAALLSIPAHDHKPTLRLTPQAQKSRTFDVLTRHIDSLAAQHPLLMVTEDAHWLDPTSIEWFEQLIDRMDARRALLLMIHRPGFIPPWKGFAIQMTSLTLNRLGRAQGSELVQRITGNKTLPREVLEHILLKTDGVPLFVEELTKSILESGVLQDAGDRYVLAHALPDHVIPATLHDSLMNRLDRHASVKEVAQIGSCIGRAFGFELLAAVTSLRAEALESALTQLVQSELVFRRGEPPDAVYTFKHALIQDAAYQSLLRSKKRILHARIAEVLENQFPDTVDTEPELLAHHYAAADMAERAIPHWLAAGRRAFSNSSLPEAVSHLSRALESTASIDATIERAERELEVRSTLGAATLALHGWPALLLRDVVKPACDLIEEGYGGPDAIMNFWSLWVHHGCRAEHRRGLAVVDRMLRHASEKGDPLTTLIAEFSASMANFWIGNYELARAHENNALEAYDTERDEALAWSFNHDPKCTLLSWAAQRVWALGYPDQARGLSDEAVEHARRVGHPFNMCWTLGNSSIAYGFCGDYSKATARIEELRSVARDQELAFMESYMVPVSICVSAVQVAEYEAAYVQGARAENVWREVGGRFWSPFVRACMARSCLGLGRPDEALDLIDGAIDQIETTGEFMYAEEIYRIAGLVHLTHARNERAAEKLWQRSLEFSGKHGTRSFELRTAMSLAGLRREQGECQAAIDLLAPVYHRFAEGFDTADLKEADALLRELA